MKPAAPLTTPFEVLIDTREQLPFAFAGLLADAAQGGGPLEVRTRRWTLQQGDYSIGGFEGRVAVERKSLEDLYGTLGSGRQRFVAELERLSAPPMEFAAVVVEADFWEILTAPPVYSKLPPKTVHRSVIAWQQRYPSIHWWTLRNRRLAEITTFRILERFWKEAQRRVSK